MPRFAEHPRTPDAGNTSRRKHDGSVEAPIPGRRRGIGAALDVAASAGAASFGNPDNPAEGRINGKSPSSLSDPGPQNPTLAKQFPSFQDPPPTDVNGMAMFWASFNNAHKRYQNGGWARESRKPTSRSRPTSRV
jgi:hypothetical protein